MAGSSPRSVEFAGGTDVGRVRSQNEDSFQIDNDLRLVLVADGMGGHIGGDIASRTAIEAVNDYILEYEPPEDGQGSPELGPLDVSVDIVRTAVYRANQRIVGLNRELGNPEGRGMGTTLVGLWLPHGLSQAVVFHVGDSRLYRFRKGRLDQVTHDHSLYQAWVDAGRSGDPPNRNIIMRALGIVDDVEADFSVQPIQAGDIYLLCSDGLNGMVPDDTIIDILADIGETSLDAAWRQLIQEANDHGGKDNVTVVLARFL
ncbi:protein phosphatase [Skermanella aerolata]|uniref:PP2C family protein-serine/threonine phosphatase n=1 Tax=Skermanella aerolata TaxID=393310 RepID=UPI003D1E1DD6